MASAESRLRGWLLYFCGWLLIGVLFAFRLPNQGSFEDVPWPLVISELGRWLLWGLLAPWIAKAIKWISERSTGSSGLGGLAQLMLNVPVAVGFTTAFAALDFLKRKLIELAGFDLPDPRLGVGLLTYDLLIYLCIAAAIYAGRILDRSRGRAVHTSALEAQLAQARLQALKAQLHPHFLFNTLNAISALMHRDVESADRMIALLSDLLRVSLENDDRHQVPLKEELEILERYLAIERIRFRDRLKIEIDVEPSCREVLVPRLILQPLVENSIIHGIALQSTAGLISIQARRKGNRLAVAVADDGPGLMDGQPLREGVGLSNTRGRLAELYGNDHRFHLGRAPVGGLEVTLEVPFELTPRFSD